MSETEPIPPTSSVTALRIPIIKKGEYDLWSMKMRQYIAITDHILWDIITNGDQATTDPASSSVPKTSLAANARRNNEKALNILLSAIPDRHLLSFHDATNAKTLWTAIKARFGGNEASKKMQKNLLKQQFETFTIGSREVLDSAYERFQHILSMLELYDATVSLKDANLKFLRVYVWWHVVATRSWDNLVWKNWKVKGSTLKQSTAEPAHIPKGYTQAISSKVPTAPNCASHSDEIICSFFAQQASMPTTHDDEDLLQIDEDAMEEIDIRWQVAMITARIRKFKTQKPWATDNNEDIDWTKEFDAEPVTYAMMALTGVEQDDWSIEFDAEHMHFGQDGLDDFDWSNKADDALVSLALMATNSEGLVELAIRNKDPYQENTKSSQPEIDRNKVIIEDWVDSDDEETDVSEIQKNTVFSTENSKISFETSHQNSQTEMVMNLGQGDLGTKGGHKTSVGTTPIAVNIVILKKLGTLTNRKFFYPSAYYKEDEKYSRPEVPHAVLSQKYLVGPLSSRMDNIRHRKPQAFHHIKGNPLGVSKSDYDLVPKESKFLEIVCPGQSDEDLKDYVSMTVDALDVMTGDIDKLDVA
ncbi:hypothetical protein Tco_0198833 [Tanacetum coccineum]